MALAGRSSVQDLAAVTLDRDLRDLWHAQRSTACSPRLPAVADGLSHRATSYPASGQSVVVACSTRRRRSRSARGWGRRGRSRVGECRTRSRSCLDHADQGIHASAPEPPRSVQCRRPSSAKAAPRRRDVERAAPQRPPRTPGWIPGPTTWRGRAAQPAAHARWNHPSPAMVAAQRFDHAPIADRSRGQRLVHPPITRHSVAPQAERRDTERRHGGPGVLRLPSPARKEAAWVTPRPTPFDSPREPVNPGKNTQRKTVPQHRCGPTLTQQQPGGRTYGQDRSPSRASSPTSHLRPTRSSARIRLTDQPCSTRRALR